MVFLAFMLFSGIAYLADPAFHAFGGYLLELESMQATWTRMYDNEWWALTRFYNTVVIGSLVCSLLLSPVLFPIVIVLVKQYRTRIHERVQKLKIVKALKGTKLYSIYQTVSRVRG